MRNADLVFVLGDSHVRSFSYSKNVVPCFIGPGRTLLLNNPELREKTASEVKGVLKYIPTDSLVVILIGEPSLRLFLEEVCDDFDGSNDFVSTFCSQFFELYHDLKKDHPGLMMLPPVPRRDPKYIKVWNKVVSTLSAEGLFWASAFDKSVVKGQLKEELVGDYIHANERLADDAMRFLGFKNHQSSDLFAWEYQYEIAGGAKIWGGTSKDLLIYDGTSKRDWSSILVKTIDANEFISILNNYFRLFLPRDAKVKVSETGEGFFTLGLRNSVRKGVNSLLETTRYAVTKRLSEPKGSSDSREVSKCKVYISVSTHLDTLDRVDLDFSDATHRLCGANTFKERSFPKNSFVVVVRSSFIRYISIRGFILLYNLSNALKRVKLRK